VIGSVGLVIGSVGLVIGRVGLVIGRVGLVIEVSDNVSHINECFCRNYSQVRYHGKRNG